MSEADDMLGSGGYPPEDSALPDGEVERVRVDDAFSDIGRHILTEHGQSAIPAQVEIYRVWSQSKFWVYCKGVNKPCDTYWDVRYPDGFGTRIRDSKLRKHDRRR